MHILKLDFIPKFMTFLHSAFIKKTNTIDDDSIQRANNHNTKESPLIGRFIGNSHIHFKY